MPIVGEPISDGTAPGVNSHSQGGAVNRPSRVQDHHHVFVKFCPPQACDIKEMLEELIALGMSSNDS
eukprot:6204900-Pleurochrysis_carterae.AAC.2